MRTFFFFLFLLLVGSTFEGYAQSVNLSDSLKNVFTKKPTLTGKLDSRNSFITGKSAQIRGVKVGVSFGNRMILGLGYNWLNTDFLESVQTNEGSVKADIRFQYLAPFVEYVFYKKNNWQADIPVQIGFGRSFLTYEKYGARYVVERNNIVLYEPSMIVEYQVLGIFGIGGGVGYRLMLKNNREIDQQFTSPMYILRFRILFDGVRKLLEN